MTDLQGFHNKVMNLMVKLRNENIFDDALYDEIFGTLEIFVEEWKTQDSIPKKTFIICLYLIDFLAGGSRFLSEEDNEKLEDAMQYMNFSQPWRIRL
ncbi:hypothetical protein C2D64_02610 [Listeria ivanovii]|uniref:hypothetical protein n=1 Tax=Listeria ivanovii TaxID=1638 RepID=UPI000DA74E1A|nr:hypothetical protein [Listeria ivanovii]PZG35940.1 hypothetical protein C2D64_02610 [Listeria ivanovii]PZG49166.1 hypothetical protein C2D66_02690 [Listeria ivanovii]PZH13897.1 hypothetical protein C2D65_02605 [Listeria ivanovii]